jgi:hypothetical protein
MFVYFGQKTDSFPNGVGQAIYTSTPVELVGVHCVSFFYRLQKVKSKPGPTLSLLTISDEKESVELWDTNLDHGKQWIAVKREIKQSNISRSIQVSCKGNFDFVQRILQFIHAFFIVYRKWSDQITRCGGDR